MLLCVVLAASLSLLFSAIWTYRFIDSQSGLESTVSRVLKLPSVRREFSDSIAANAVSKDGRRVLRDAPAIYAAADLVVTSPEFAESTTLAIERLRVSSAPDLQSKQGRVVHAHSEVDEARSGCGIVVEHCAPARRDDDRPTAQKSCRGPQVPSSPRLVRTRSVRFRGGVHGPDPTSDKSAAERSGCVVARLARRIGPPTVDVSLPFGHQWTDFGPQPRALRVPDCIVITFDCLDRRGVGCGGCSGNDARRIGTQPIGSSPHATRVQKTCGAGPKCAVTPRPSACTAPAAKPLARNACASMAGMVRPCDTRAVGSCPFVAPP